MTAEFVLFIAIIKLLSPRRLNERIIKATDILGCNIILPTV